VARTYSIGEVSDLLGVRPHVIRYWEQEMPMLAPRKGLTGRRVYGPPEIRLLLRLKHLLHDERYTVEGARQKMWEDVSAAPEELGVLISSIRDDLLDAWMRLRRRRAQGSPAGPGVPKL